MDWLHYVLIAACVVLSAVFFFVGLTYRKRVAEKEIGSAEEEARRILNEAIKSAEAKKREALVEAKEEIIKNKNEAEREIRDRRAEIQRTERRIQQKDEALDRKLDNVDAKEEQLNRKIKEAEASVAEAQKLKQEQLEVLERMSGFTVEEAKAHIIQAVESDARHDVAVKLREIESDLKEDADRKAKEILSLAIQKCSAEYVSEATVSVVPLPNDEMKGRIIGREGRNIRAIEAATGVSILIDDTPEAVVISCFDPVRKEVARQLMALRMRSRSFR